MAFIINGKEIANVIKEELKNTVSSKQTCHVPHLAVVQVGDNPASSVYVRNKQKACEYIGIHSSLLKLEENCTESTLIDVIEGLNHDSSVTGILVQLPLPKQIDESRIINTIDPNKDVDGFHPMNVGKLWLGESGFRSCTPAGIIELLQQSNIKLEGSNVVVIGRSNIVGKPMVAMLLQENATVTICHSKTNNLKEITKQADILIVAMGSPKFITHQYVKNNAVVIDVGIHRLEDGSLCGDVDYADVYPIVSAISPVPGGVGPMTIAMLLKNAVGDLDEMS